MIKLLHITAGVVVLLLLAGCTGGASYDAKIQSIAVINSTEVSVTVKITNTSQTADTPICVVDVYTQAGTDIGSASGQISSKIAGGETATAALPVDVKAPGVPNISEANSVIACS